MVVVNYNQGITEIVLEALCAELDGGRKLRRNSSAQPDARQLATCYLQSLASFATGMTTIELLRGVGRMCFVFELGFPKKVAGTSLELSLKDKLS
jgi:hypothetical protein